jgi:hypothetical protein
MSRLTMFATSPHPSVLASKTTRKPLLMAEPEMVRLVSVGVLITFGSITISGAKGGGGGGGGRLGGGDGGGAKSTYSSSVEGLKGASPSRTLGGKLFSEQIW